VVVIKENKAEENTKGSQMSSVEMSMNQIQEMPALLGEPDVLKTYQLMPGIQFSNESSPGMHVRGGSPEQNLTLLDEAVVYNPSHLLGFFSVFNADAINSTKLIKSIFPAKYGGRLSSVLEIVMKEGNDKKYHLKGGVGLLASKLMIEGPLIREKSSFMVSARRSNVELTMNPFLDEEDQLPFYFYDLNAKLNYRFSQKDRIYLSGYFGNDVLTYPLDSLIDFKVTWGNKTGTLRWNHLFNDKLFSNTSLIYSDFSYNTTIKDAGYSLKITSAIQDVNARVDFDYYPSLKHNLNFGANYIHHTFIPNADREISEDFDTTIVDKYVSTEIATYIKDKYELNQQWTVEFGLRMPSFYYNTSVYSSIEPRLSVRYLINPATSLKIGYNEVNQYVHMVTNSNAEVPYDLWLSSTDIIKPQFARHVVAGMYKNLKNNQYECSLELYYKAMENQIEFKEGSQIFIAQELERELTFGRGWSYGSEWFLQKREGKLNGWLSYTLSWTNRQFDELNNGDPFSVKYDRRHMLSLASMYHVKNWTFSSVFMFATGSAVTLPAGKYLVPEGHTYGFHSDFPSRNGYRLDPYHRLDLGISYKRKRPAWSYEWKINAYNVYNRQNPWFIFFGQDDNQIKAYQASFFSMIPSISFNFQF